jgi:hypothetical protein
MPGGDPRLSVGEFRTTATPRSQSKRQWGPLTTTIRMGSRDSSKTRVAPIFNQLLERDESGHSWLGALMALGSRSEVVSTVPPSPGLVKHHGKRWGANEMPLPAPRALLEHLVMNLDAPLVNACSDSGDTLTKRRMLAARDEATIAAGIAALRAGHRGKSWFILEGDSKPDALFESEDVVLCVEGKRTEARCTTSTQWMRKRSQLVRHMDSAMARFPEKRILGMLIVEGDGDADAIVPSEHWRNESKAAYEPSMLAASLPHRTATERALLRDGILGVTTWQAVCRALDIDWHSLPDFV